MHPNKNLSMFFGTLLLCSVGYGIFLPASHCAISIITIMAFSLVGVLLEVVTFWKQKIPYQKITIFYIFKGIWMLIVSLVHFIFLFAVNDAAYCDYMWCHKDAVMKDFLQSFINHAGLSTIRNQCSEIKASYVGDSVYDQLSKYLVENIAKYCVYKGDCASESDCSEKINGFTLASNRAYLIAIGVLLVIYAIYIFYFLTTIRDIKSQVDEYNTLENKDVQSIQDKSNFMIMDPIDDSQIQNKSILASPSPQELQQEQQVIVQDIEEEEQENQKQGNFVFDDDAERAKKQSKLQQKAKQILTVNKIGKINQQQQAINPANIENNNNLNINLNTSVSKSQVAGVSPLMLPNRQSHILTRLTAQQNTQQKKN